MKIERRVFNTEVRRVGDSRLISGRAVVFNQLSENLGGYIEQIAPTAFDDCDMADVRCLVNHDETLVLGRTTSKTLRLILNPDCLAFECDSPDTTYARDLAACMDRGDINQCSFGFFVASGGADWSEDPSTGVTVRTVKKIARLFDVSVVTYPAYPQTSSEVRSSHEILRERNRRHKTTDTSRRELELIAV